MTYVPFVPAPPPSAKAYELSRRLSDTIATYRSERPDASDLDIRQAIHLTSKQAGAGNQPALIAILIALLGLGLLGYFMFARGM